MYRGYKRGEVYSFTFTPIINGRAGKAYHIPAMEVSEMVALGATGIGSNATTKVTTDESEVYPSTFPKVTNTVIAKFSYTLSQNA